MPACEGLSLPISIDWEDWFQLCCPPYDGPDALDRFECRLPRATDLTLQFCEDLGARATWFCLADQAARHPDLVRRIAKAGHEVALHGSNHSRACGMDRAAFVRWVEEGKARLEAITGAPLAGFRAPEWSLRGPAEDYWRELPGLGFRYDSSRAPLAVLGSASWPRRAHELEPGFVEFPPPVAGMGRVRVPLWGWGLRTLPRPWLRRQLHVLARSDARTPLVLHPWELDEGQPRLEGVSAGHRFAHGAGLKGYQARLRRLLAGMSLKPLASFLPGS